MHAVHLCGLIDTSLIQFCTDMETAPSDAKENKGLKKAWRRLSGVFKSKSDSPTSPATLEPAEGFDQRFVHNLVADAASDRRSTSSKEPPAPSPAADQPASQIVEVDPATETTDSQDDMAPTRSDVDKRVQKARDAMAKQGIEFNDANLMIPDLSRNKNPYDRVHRNIRMRVRYTCHNCSTIYGHDRVCVSCQHRRCRDCVRYPPRKAERNARKEEAMATAAESQEMENQNCPCHECQTIVQTGIDECPNCHHKICERCLKEAMLTTSNDEHETTKPVEKPMESAPQPAEAVSTS